MNSVNCYEDSARAAAYATLEFRNTYHLAFRDLPAILNGHVKGRRALDFGCGTGRSTRFLRVLGFDVTGIDTSESMLRMARATDPTGDYRLVPEGEVACLGGESFDLVLCAFPFDNIPNAMKVKMFVRLAKLLAKDGTILNVVSSPEIYTHEWASFSTRDFPENAAARNGDIVRIVTTDHQDQRPVEDILCTDQAYRAMYGEAGLDPIKVFTPLANGDERYCWVSETHIAPWVIYVLKRAA